MSLPKSIGKYPVVGVLGKGAMGIVYRGYDPLIRRPVAIKTIAKDLIDVRLNASDIAARFRREAQAAGNLNHPGIVGVYEYGETDDYAFIAMECVEGTSLRDYFSQKAQFPEGDAVSIMAQLLDALGYAHDHEVVHRDVKPANIIIMKNGRIKLADFGIARLEASDRTQTGLIMGTPGYIAPEYYFSSPIDHRVDIFASGIVFYELLSGEPPFHGTPEAIMRAVCYEDPPPPSGVGFSRGLAQYDPIIVRAMKKLPEERFPSTGAFRQAILSEYRHTLPDSITTTVILPNKSGEGTGSAPPTPPPTGWDASVLAKVTTELTRSLGPVAKVMVQRAARQHKNLRSLVNALASHIDNSQEREKFRHEVIGPDLSLTQQTMRTARTLRAPAALDAGGTERKPDSTAAALRLRHQPATEQDLADLTRALVGYIGPIGRIIVKRVQAEGMSRMDLFTRAAEAIESEPIRDRFMKEFGLYH